ncbi:hypothetical protein DPMN_064353 [Dreissena polymorpha]|uniref:Uncharacterized protein n=1 Tax=Dreissena polymorpha TaxID=45954 RepID=A0A9D4HKZ9_DREPO|nr:hypothetical protein DPMN_064353 [Dreissena polymorpha]
MLERQGARYTSDHEYFFYQKYGQSAIPSQLEGQGQRSRPSSRNQTERPNSRQGQGEQLPAGNYGNYQDPPLSGARHVSDSNVAKFSNVYRPASRGTSSSSMETNIHNPSYQHNYVKNSVVNPVQPFDRLPNHPLNNQRGTPVQDHERISNYRNIAGGQGQNNSNYQVVNRNTPTNFTPLERRSIANNYPYRQDLDPPPSSGSYGNSVYGYRDPVFTSMAGKRPVQTLQQQQQQPNSAKV